MVRLGSLAKNHLSPFSSALVSRVVNSQTLFFCLKDSTPQLGYTCVMNSSGAQTTGASFCAKGSCLPRSFCIKLVLSKFVACVFVHVAVSQISEHPGKGLFLSEFWPILDISPYDFRGESNLTRRLRHGGLLHLL
jgi:hypothetical protein